MRAQLRFERTAPSTRATALVLGGVLAIAAAAFASLVFAGRMFGAGPPPRPTITSGPANPTNQTTATFAFAASGAASFLCRLDGAAFTACTSPQMYPGPLSVGRHEFKVKAKDAAGHIGPETSYAWKIVAAAPPTVPTITSKPPNPTFQTSATFTYAEALGSPLSIGPEKMEGDLKATAGDWISVGYHFKYDGHHPATSVSFMQNAFTFAVTCTDGSFPTDSTWTITAPDATYPVAANDAAHQPWTSEHAAASYQAAARLPALCGSKPGNIRLSQGATFTSMVSSPDSSDRIDVQFHYRDPNAKGKGNIDCSDPIQNPDPGLSVCGAGLSPTASITPGLDASVVSFVCSLDNGPFIACGGGATGTQTYTNLVPGNHTFRVEATSTSLTSPPASYSWLILKPLTVSGDAVDLLYPGGPTRSFATKLVNMNGIAITVTTLTTTKVTGSFPAGCSPGDFTIGQVDLSTATPTAGQIVIPANGSITLPSQGVAAPTVSMSSVANQDACQNATFQVDYGVSANYDGSFTGSGNASIGTTSSFTIVVGPTTGGPLGPTSPSSASAVVDTVQVTVTNNDLGFELLHQITYRITTGWSATPAGHLNCTASDFSIGGEPAGQAHTVVYDEEIAPGGQATHSFTIRMVETGLDQDACQGVKPSVTVVVS